MGIGVLGPLTFDGAPPALPRRDRVVLAALAVAAGAPVPAERLADAVWSDTPPPSWSKVVQSSIVRLRKLLGRHVIETLPEGYRLTLPPHDVDAHEFERLVDEVVALRKQQEEQWREDQRALADVLTPRQHARFMVMLARFHERVRQLRDGSR